jgi:hypothetical protein
MKCSSFLTGVGSIQTPYFLRIGSSSSVVIQPAKPGDSWFSDFLGEGGVGGGVDRRGAVRGENFSIL